MFNLKASIAQFLKNGEEKNLRPSTLKNRRNFCKRLIKYFHNKPFELSVTQEYISHLRSAGLTSSSIVQEIKSVKSFVNFLNFNDLLKDNWTKKLISPKVHANQPQLVSQEVAEKIIEAGTETGPGDRSRSAAIKDDVRLALKLILRLGLRISEARTIKGSDLQLFSDPPIVFINSKGGDREQMPITNDMIELLKGKVNEERVFKITPDNCNDALRRGARKLGISVNIHCHLLRHIACSTWANNGISLQELKRLMRHKNIATTIKYYTQFAIKDLAITLNSQKIVGQGLSVSQVFDLVGQAIEKTGVSGDGRFTVTTSHEEENYAVKITLKGI